MRGEGRVFQRGNRWWIAYWGFLPNGDTGEVRESSGETEEAARELLKQRVREVANHRDGIKRFQGPNQERITVDELLDSVVADYRQREIKSLRHQVGPNGKGGHLKPVRAYFGHFRALRVTPDRIRAYVTQRQKAGLSNAKINRETEILSRAFKLALEDGRLSYCPKVFALPEHNARQGFFEKAEFEAVAARLPGTLADVARFAYGTGWRRGEIIGLRWENVDRANREVRIPTSKSGEPRSVPLDDVLWQIIERRWTAREFEYRPGEPALSAFVFHRQGKPLGNFTKTWAAACIGAGLGVRDKKGHYEGKLFHDLRRTAVRDMIRAGVPQAVAKKISGHETDSIFERYNIVSEDDKLEALNRRRSYLDAREAKLNIVPLAAVSSSPHSDRDSDK